MKKTANSPAFPDDPATAASGLTKREYAAIHSIPVAYQYARKLKSGGISFAEVAVRAVHLADELFRAMK